LEGLRSNFGAPKKRIGETFFLAPDILAHLLYCRVENNYPPVSYMSPDTLDLIACPRCHSPLRLEGDSLVCSKCSEKFQIQSGVPSFVPPKLAERFSQAQEAEGKHHKEAWVNLHVGHLPWVKSFEDYADWLESFYRVGFYAFGLCAGYFREKTVLEIGSGPFGFSACIPSVRGLAIDPLMVSFSGYMQPHWRPQPVRIAAMGEEMPVPTGIFDAAVAINTLDHTLEPEKIFKETWRALKPGALFFINNNVKSAAGKMLGTAGERFGITRLTEVFHPHAFTRESLISGCEAAGFKVIGDFFAKATAPESQRQHWSWMHAVRHQVENEVALWVLAEKPAK
jgi:uncharacterized protein YbaR (Trm112 family)